MPYGETLSFALIFYLRRSPLLIGLWNTSSMLWGTGCSILEALEIASIKQVSYVTSDSSVEHCNHFAMTGAMLLLGLRLNMQRPKLLWLFAVLLKRATNTNVMAP